MLILMLKLLVLMGCVMTILAGNFNTDVKITWGDGRAKILNNGAILTLSMDKYSGSGFESNNGYIFGRFDMQLKLVPGDSAGTVTTFYMTSGGGAHHDEIDFEFLGNSSGQPYTVHTNIFAQGMGSKEQEFHLWFDPTLESHLYSIVWNPQRVMWLIDNKQIRVFNNNEAIGVQYPKSQAMKVVCSLWNADDWATQGGRVKTNWALAPFTATYGDVNFNGNACTTAITNRDILGAGSLVGQPTCAPTNPSDNGWFTLPVDGKTIMGVHQKFITYNYCTDVKRFPQGLPPECKLKTF